MQATNANDDDKDLNQVCINNDYFNIFDILRQDSAIKYIINTGIEPSKLLLGLPAFGKKFRLTSDLHDLGSPATSVGSVSYTDVNQISDENLFNIFILLALS